MTYRKRLLPLAERIERLQRHFSGIEHFRGKQYLVPKAVNLNDTFAVQFAVLECCWRQKLSTAETALVLGISQAHVEFAVDRVIQNTQ